MMYLAISESPTETYPQGRLHKLNKILSFEHDPASRRVLVNFDTQRLIDVVYEPVDYLIAATSKARRDDLISEYILRGRI